MKKVLKFVGYALLGFIVLVILAAIFGDKKPAAPSGSTPAAAAAPAAPLMQTTAQELSKAYEENTVAADAKFKGKRFRVTGTVKSINTGLMDTPYLVLRGGVNQFMEPQFQFEKSENEALAKLKKGSKVVIECEGAGDIAKTPMSNECKLIE